ncbi:MAG TPA: DUF2905 domain-containing protein [bacterium]|nr:DUF2905 domain-containing protein [bacterium]
MSELSSLGKGLALTGLVLILLGGLLALAGKVPWIGRLPGDIRIEKPGFSLYFPLGTCLLASVLLSSLAWLFSRLR